MNALHLASTYSREDVIKVLLPKKGVDVYCPGGVSREYILCVLISNDVSVNYQQC